MKRSNKHQMAKVKYENMTGGINIMQSGEDIELTEMQECQNFIYKTGTSILAGRGGLQEYGAGLPTGTIRCMFYEQDLNIVYIVTTDRKLYAMEGDGGLSYIGVLYGEGYPCFCRFMDDTYVASTNTSTQYANLQYIKLTNNQGVYSYELKDVEDPNCPICSLLFVRGGRLGTCAVNVATSDGSVVTYSSTGDAKSDTAWTENTNDESSCQWVEIGYGDSGDINSVVPLATDLVIIKSNGNVFQFTGDSGDSDSWSVERLGTNLDTIGLNTAFNVGANVVFISRRGLRSLQASQDYGNISALDIGDKFNKLITNTLEDNVEAYHLKRHHTILIRPSSSDKKYMVAYNYRMGVATTLKWGIDVDSIVETNTMIFVASGNKIYQYTEVAQNDAGVSIDYKIKLKDAIDSDEVLIKAVDLEAESSENGSVTVSVTNSTTSSATRTMSITMPCNTRTKKKCNHSTDRAIITLQGTDRFEFDHLQLDLVVL